MAKRTTQADGPQFVQYFGPLLDALRALGGSATPGEVVAQIAHDLALPDEVQNEVTPSGVPRFANRVAWARFYLYREGLLGASQRGIWNLTEKGQATHLTPATARDLFQKWSKVFADERKRSKDEPPSVDASPPENDAAPTAGYRGQVNPLVSFKVLFQCKAGCRGLAAGLLPLTATGG